MTEAASFSCPACQQRYRWRSDWAGRVIRCLCGGRLRCPVQPIGHQWGEIVQPPPEQASQQAAAHPGSLASPLPSELAASADHTQVSGQQPPSAPITAEVQEEDDLELDLDGPEPAPVAAVAHQPGDPCPSCGGPTKPEAVVCLNCGYHFVEGRHITTNATTIEEDEPDPILGGGRVAEALAQKEAQRDEDEVNPLVLQVYVPAIMFLVGVMLDFVNIYFLEPADRWGSLPTMSEAILRTGVGAGITLVLLVPMMLMGIFMVANWMGIAFGPLHFALVKLLAICYFPAEAARSIALMVDTALEGHGLIGFVVGGLLQFVIYYAMMSWLFDLDAGEVWITILMLYAMSWIVFATGGILMTSMFA